jgi:hypothetical protein
MSSALVDEILHISAMGFLAGTFTLIFSGVVFMITAWIAILTDTLK